MSVDTIPPADLPEALPWSLCVWDNYVSNTGFISWGRLLCVFSLGLWVPSVGVFLVVDTVILSVAIDVFTLNLVNGPP